LEELADRACHFLGDLFDIVPEDGLSSLNKEKVEGILPIRQVGDQNVISRGKIAVDEEAVEVAEDYILGFLGTGTDDDLGIHLYPIVTGLLEMLYQVRFRTLLHLYQDTGPSMRYPETIGEFGAAFGELDPCFQGAIGFYDAAMTESPK